MVYRPSCNRFGASNVSHFRYIDLRFELGQKRSNFKKFDFDLCLLLSHVTVILIHCDPCAEYIDELVEADKSGERREIAAGTFMSPGSWEAALFAAGTTLSAMQHILDCHGKVAYALVRPPGHHSQPSQADGYCFLNNAALAVKLALNSGSCSRVAVIDIDVHYGNGTAEGFYSSDEVLTVSLHMNHGSWGSSHPQKGSIDELGEDLGLGYNLNIPLPNGTGDRGYEYAMTELVVPAVRRFGPDMVVLVVGQDSSAVSSFFAQMHVGYLTENLRMVLFTIIVLVTGN